MNCTERVVAAINHQEPDRVPVYPVLGGCCRGLVGATYKEWATNADLCAESFLKAQKMLGVDCIVTLIGAVPPTNVVFGSDEEWDRICKEHIDLMAKGGGFVLGTGCEYPANAPWDRAKRMIEIANTYGVYAK